MTPPGLPKFALGMNWCPLGRSPLQNHAVEAGEVLRVEHVEDEMVTPTLLPCSWRKSFSQAKIDVLLPRRASRSNEELLLCFLLSSWTYFVS